MCPHLEKVPLRKFSCPLTLMPLPPCTRHCLIITCSTPPHHAHQQPRLIPLSYHALRVHPSLQVAWPHQAQPAHPYRATVIEAHRSG
jgi:hypothetical protein